MVSTSSSLAKLMVLRIDSRDSPGKPRMKSPCTSRPSFLVSLVNWRARSTVAPFFTFFSTCGSPDSYPTISKRQPASFWAFSVSKSVVTRDVQLHVRFSGFSFEHSSTVRAFWMLNVSSSKKYSFTQGQYSFACAISRAMLSEERLRHACPLSVCGHKQNVHCAGQPRVEYRATNG